MTLDRKLFRQVLGSFLSGVTVVTVRGPDGLRGMTASAFTSVSLDPPLVLVCVSRTAHLHALLRPDGEFAISLLAEDQAPLSTHFAGYAPDVVPVFEEAPGRVPVLAGALGWLDCSVFHLVEAGDHTVVLGQVRSMASREGAPLAYFRGKYGRFVQNAS